MIIKGFLLGLANGGACLATCAAVLIPLILGEGQKSGSAVREHAGLLARFLAGRLTGYLLFAVLAWAANWMILRDPAARSTIFALAYFVLAGMMLAYGLGKLKISCALPPRTLSARLGRVPALRPLIPSLFGLLTGINLCPPFLLAFTNAALNGKLVNSLAFFAAFFVGTSLYLLPVPFIGLFQRGSSRMAADLQWVGRLSAGLMSAYYIFSGVLMFVEGGIL
jgi:sulfite exporter TauE/SafE